jgi:hypothetical protein
MQKLTVKKSRLVELNRGRLDLSLGGIVSVFDCGNETLSKNLLCKATVTSGPVAMAVDLYSRRVAAQAG